MKNWEIEHNAKAIGAEYSIWTEEGGRICTLTDGPKAEARAKIIAAAPELLANLKRMIINYPDSYAREAIKKATS